MAKKQARMGRPRMRPKDRRSRGLTIRFTPAEFEEIERIAKAAGVTATDFIRQSCLGKGKWRWLA